MSLRRQRARLLRPDGSPDPRAEIQRFDIHQRLQYWLLIGSATLLALSGWPLSTHGVGGSQALVGLFGGQPGAALLHRLAAACMLTAVAYHGLWLVMKLAQNRLAFTMLPTVKDLRDAGHNFLYYVGVRPEPPRFPRFSYLEKFDYWAVFFGASVMTVSGVIRWFPDTVAAYAPAWVYEVALYAHADEGLLLALALFGWHFYHAHLRPPTFPVSRTYLTGRITLGELEARHGAEYNEIVAALRRDEGAP